MSEVATKNITFWNTTDYKYPGFGKTVEVPDGLGGTIAITYNKIDYDDRGWRGKPDGDTPVTEDRFLSGEIENNFSLTGKVKGITATMPQIRTLGKENNYSVTLDFSKYKASAAGSKATDGATSGDTYLAISRFFNGSKTGYTTIKVTAKTVDGSELDLGDWKLFNSGALPNMGRWGGHNARIFLDVANQTISGKNSQGKQEFCPTPPNPGSSFGTDTGLGLFELPSNQRYVSITLSFKQKKIQGGIPNDLHDIYVASNTSSTSSIDATPQTQPTDKPVDINNGLQLHLPLNEIVENAAKQKEVVDISAGKLNGKVNSATVVADDRFGKCINFDGVDDYIELPTTAIPQTGEITISFWANGGKSLPKATTILWAPDQNNHYMVNIHLPWGNVIHFDCGNTTTSDNSGDRISKIAEAVDFKDKWTYWTFTKNVTTGEMSIYLNGSLWHNGTGKNKPINSITQLKFGASDAFYDGKVAHLRIYDRVLSPEEINECMKVDGTPPPMDINRGLQLHLPLNEIVENAAKEKEVVDISAGKLNGKVNGATVVADSRFGNCINFDGVDDYIELPTETIPESNEITISFWANGGKSLPQDNSILWAVNKNNGYVVNIHLPSPGREIYFDCGGNVSYDRIRKSARDVDFKGQWIHWVFTKNVATGEMNIYLNCNLWHSATGKKIALSSVTMVKLGSQRNTRFYDGKVAHLRIYNRVLSLEEINECMKVDGTPPPMDINRGLQLHLPLNEIVENAAKEKEVVDISAGKLNGKVNGATVVADSKFGNCINFDGVDDYIELPTATIPQTGEITISFWANGGKSLPKDNSIILVVEKNNQRVVNIHLPWSDSQIYFDCGNTTTADDSYDRIEKPSQITDFKDKWTYWVVTKNVATGEMKIYLNGSLWQSGVGKQNPLNSITQVKFGCGYGFYDGKVAHLRIYNRVLSPKEINECMKVDETPPPMDINRGLQLHLPLNEIVENAAKEKEVVDVSAAKLKGKVNGNPTVEVDSQLGNCLNFDGVDDYIQMPEMNVDYSQGLTVGAWVHYESFKNWSRIIDFGNDPGSDNILFANQGTTANLTLHNYLGATNHPIQVDGTLEQKKWLYLAATIDESGNGKIYKNGQEVGSGSSSIPNNVNRTQNYVGKSNWSADQLFHGKMSNLRLYNRALSKEEINECMKVDETPPPMDINRGLQLHLPLNEIVENAAKEKEVVDVSGVKLNGKVHSGTVVADDRFGKCLNFNGNDDYILINPMPNFPSEVITVYCWIKSKNTQKSGTLLSYANSQTDNAFI
ncbi:MAG: LamG domain-containing protein, partial [Trichodesmium sp.]